MPYMKDKPVARFAAQMLHLKLAVVRMPRNGVRFMLPLTQRARAGMRVV